jgi:hypothetical protein
MADGILWQLVSGVDPLGQYAAGLQDNQRQQNILQQLAGQKEDRQLRRDEFGYRQGRDIVSDKHFDQTFQAGRTDAANMNAYRNAELALRKAQFARGDVPAGYERDPNDPTRLRPRAGGPQDPATIRATVLAQREPMAPSIKEIELPNGNKASVVQNPDGSFAPLNIPGVTDAAPTNPYAVGGKTSTDQSNAALYADRMTSANKVLTDLEGINKGGAGFIGGELANSGYLPNAMMSPDRQRVIQAQRDFVNAVLRRESGAAINQSEFDNAAKQYFPQPGDSDAVIAQKRQNRETALHGFYRAAGPQYRVPQGAPAQPSGLAPGQTTTINGVTIRRVN